MRIVAPRPGSGPILDRIGWTIFQPGGAVVAPKVFSAAYRASIGRQIPRDTELFHWVGTGIELLGFEFERIARQAAVPFLVTPALHRGEWGDAAIDGRLYRRAHHVIVLSEDERRRMAQLGVPDHRVTRVSLGPTVTEGGNGQRFRHLHDLRADVPLVAFVGRRSRYKGLVETIAASDSLLRSGLEHRLVIAGPPGDLTSDELRGAGVIDVGLCSEEEKADLLAAASVLCVPSSSESYGIVYVDAWSRGVPVIASRGQAVADLVRPGVDGLVVDQHVADVTDALYALITRPELARSLGSAGRARQIDELSWERFRTDHEAAIRAGTDELLRRAR